MSSVTAAGDDFERRVMLRVTGHCVGGGGADVYAGDTGRFGSHRGREKWLSWYERDWSKVEQGAERCGSRHWWPLLGIGERIAAVTSSEFPLQQKYLFWRPGIDCLLPSFLLLLRLFFNNKYYILLKLVEYCIDKIN